MIYTAKKSMIKNFDVTGIGVSTIDFINVVENFSSSEDVQKTKQIQISGGGPVSTAIVTLAKLGARTAMIDRIGDDLPGQMIISEYLKNSIDTSGINISGNCTSSLATILVRESDGSRIIYYSPSSAPELSRNDINYDLLQNTRYIHLNGRHLSAAMASAEFAKKRNIKVSFDGGSHRFREELVPLIKLTDICIVTRDFAESYSSKSDIFQAAEFIQQAGPELVVITAASEGSWLFTNDIKGYHQKAFNIDNLIDTTGCGDCYHGAFLYGLVKNWDLYKTVKFASAAAVLNARALGGRAALPAEEEVFTLINSQE